MPEPRTQRRLAAILAADVVGFSRMVGADEEGTLAALREVWASCFHPMVDRFQGRVVKMMGDGALVEFASAVNAVECAIAIQGAMTARNVQTGPAAPITFRIGVNVGDIVIEGDDILGDGVNIAARLEAEATTGGILVSESVHAQIRGKVAAVFQDAGALALKNIAVPVQAWRWVAAVLATPATPSLPTDASPAIAVLPFTNMSGDPEQEYFSDGVTEDIITDLSKVSGLMVIARNSSFAYKGKSPDIRVVGRELGVTSVLEGSIRRAGNRVRITAQLIDAGTGGHLWAERYDRDLTDIFAVQDEVTLQIVGALRLKLNPSARPLLAIGNTSNVEAHDYFLRGREFLFAKVRNRETFGQAVAAFRSAAELDPEYAEPLAGLSIAYSLNYNNHWADTPDTLGLAAHFATQAVEKGPGCASAHHSNAVAKMWRRDLAGGKSAAQTALELNPNFSPSHAVLGLIKSFLGQPLTAIPHLEHAILLDPASAQQYMHFLGFAYLLAGQYEVAAAQFRERIRLVPTTDLSRAFLAAALGHLGKAAEAKRVWQELTKVNPRYSYPEHMSRLPFQNPADAEKITGGLTKAGLPE